MCDKHGTLHWTAYIQYSYVVCIVCVRIIGTLTIHRHENRCNWYSLERESEIEPFHQRKKSTFSEPRPTNEYILDLHGSMSMSSDTLYSNFPFIRSSMEYFPYRPLVCWGPIGSDPFTLYALMLGNADCIKYSAIEITKTELTGRCERILPFVIWSFVLLHTNGNGINHRAQIEYTNSTAPFAREREHTGFLLFRFFFSSTSR